MSTIGALIERLYRTYLYPPDHRPAQAHLDGAITNSDTTIVFKNFVIPEDEELVRGGAIIEMGSELAQLRDYDPVTLTATNVIRGVMGTTAVNHADDDPILLSPPFPRLSVFEAVADNIISLYPRLYTVAAAEIVSVGAGIAPMDDDLAVEVVEAWVGGYDGTQDIDARIVDYHPSVGGRALVTNLQVGDIWVRYRKRFGEPADESATYASLGLEPRWVNIVMLGTCADLFAGRDLPASHVEWVEAVLQAENIPVGTRSSLAQRLASYREYLIEAAKKEMRAEYRAKTHMRQAAQVRVRSPFG